MADIIVPLDYLQSFYSVMEKHFYRYIVVKIPNLLKNEYSYAILNAPYRISSENASFGLITINITIMCNQTLDQYVEIIFDLPQKIMAQYSFDKKFKLEVNNFSYIIRNQQTKSIGQISSSITSSIFIIITATAGSVFSVLSSISISSINLVSLIRVLEINFPDKLFYYFEDNVPFLTEFSKYWQKTYFSITKDKPFPTKKFVSNGFSNVIWNSCGFLLISYAVCILFMVLLGLGKKIRCLSSLEKT